MTINSTNDTIPSSVYSFNLPLIPPTEIEAFKPSPDPSIVKTRHFSFTKGDGMIHNSHEGDDQFYKFYFSKLINLLKQYQLHLQKSTYFFLY